MPKHARRHSFPKLVQAVVLRFLGERLTIMETPELITDRGLQHWLRALRPLLWWAAFVLILLAIHTHQQWMEQTRLVFSVSLEGHPLQFEANATFDGRPITSGDRIPLGSHALGIVYNKAEPFSTNLFIWYGLKELGGISLKRASGRLEVDVVPPARILSVTGPEFTFTLTNSSGMTSSIPTDEYVVVARYAHSEERENVAVAFGSRASKRIAPSLGTLLLECNQPGASFQLQTADGRLVEPGVFPSSISEVPHGVYTLASQHHRSRTETRVSITAGTTNITRVEFVYGTAILETDPPGVQVTGSDGIDWGETPITLTELHPGRWPFTLHKEGYEPIENSLPIVAQSTNFIHTNLLSRSYTSAMTAARQYMAAGDYGRALQTATDALSSKPGDISAGEIVTKAGQSVSLGKAEMLGRQGNYVAAIRELEVLLRTLPDNEHARALMGEFRLRQGEEAEKAHQTRLTLVRGAFSKLLSRHSDSALFSEHDFKTEKKAATVVAAVVRSLQNSTPTFTIGSVSDPEPEVTSVVGKQEFSGGARIAVLVIGQMSDEETEVFFKVLEYKAEAANPFSIGALINMPVAKNYIPLHPTKVGQLTDKMKAQIDDGVKSMTERILDAIGQAAPTIP